MIRFSDFIKNQEQAADRWVGRLAELKALAALVSDEKWAVYSRELEFRLEKQVSAIIDGNDLSPNKLGQLQGEVRFIRDLLSRKDRVTEEIKATKQAASAAGKDLKRARRF